MEILYELIMGNYFTDAVLEGWKNTVAIYNYDFGLKIYKIRKDKHKNKAVVTIVFDGTSLSDFKAMTFIPRFNLSFLYWGDPPRHMGRIFKFLKEDDNEKREIL